MKLSAIHHIAVIGSDYARSRAFYVDTLGFAVETFVDNCITGITANEERCREHVENSVGIVTTLAPIIGYQQAADIAKKALAQNRPVREVILDEKILSPEEIDRILDPVSMTEPGSIR